MTVRTVDEFELDVGDEHRAAAARPSPPCTPASTIRWRSTRRPRRRAGRGPGLATAGYNPAAGATYPDGDVGLGWRELARLIKADVGLRGVRRHRWLGHHTARARSTAAT